MAKAEKTAVVPRLRIAEFRGEPGWVTGSLGAIAKFSSGGTPSKDEPSYWNGSIPWISASSMYETIVADSELKVTSSAIGNGTRLARKGSILILVRGSMLFNRVPICIASMDVAFNQDVKALDLRTDVNEKFVLYQLIAASTRIPVNETGIGAGKIETDVLTDLSIHLPSQAEQQKIADCLSSLDELIAAQGRKVEALKTYKRGLMQQLFPREGEPLPRLRFPEFTRTSAWHSQKVASLLSKASIAVSVEPEETYREIGIRSHGKGIFHKEPVFGKVIGDKRVFKVVQDALVLNIVFAWEQAVATTSDKEVGMIASHRFPMYVAKPGMCDVEYIKGFFLTKEGKRLLGVASPGGAGRNKTLGQKDFENLEIALPVSVNEQTRIANCLSSCDATITIESHKLESLKAHKNGLMQQLFPSLEEA